jgi:hypothetical protein
MRHAESPERRTTGVGAHQHALRKATSSTKWRRSREALTARVLPDGHPVRGCEAQTLRRQNRVSPRSSEAGRTAAKLAEGGA